jgi:hypothetical protein
MIMASIQGLWLTKELGRLGIAIIMTLVQIAQTIRQITHMQADFAIACFRI